MKILDVIFALCLLAVAQRCPKTSTIQPNWIKHSDIVVKVRVIGKDVDEAKGSISYDVAVLRFYKALVPVMEITIRNKCNIPLKVGKSYVLGCNRFNVCHFMRNYSNLTLPERRLLRNSAQVHQRSGINYKARMFPVRIWTIAIKDKRFKKDKNGAHKVY